MRNLKWICVIPIRLLGLALTLSLFAIFRPVAKYVPVGISGILLLVYSWSVGIPVDDLV